jgi:hypothetical protein
MPPQQNKAPDFIPAQAPDFIPAEQPTADAAPPDDRNKLQRAFDNLTTVTPEQDAHTPAALKPLAHFGAGAIQGAGQPFVHPLKTIEGIGDTIAHPIDTAKQMGHAAMEDPAKMAGNLVGGADVGGVLGEAGGGILAKIPTRAKAGGMFENVMSKAATEPVDLTRSLPILERAQQLSARGHGSIGALDNLYKRINTVNPLDYREARDWASSLSRLNANDKMSASPSLQGEVGKLSHAFNEDVGGAAHRAGVGEDYEQAMRDYHRASQIRDTAKGIAKWAIPAAAGGGIASYGLRKVMQ